MSTAKPSIRTASAPAGARTPPSAVAAIAPGAFVRPKRVVSRIFWHCSASDNPAHDNIATMRRWHLERGWKTVGYHFFIRKDGMIERGRGLEIAPAAQAGHNAGTIAICLHGLEERKFTAAQFAAARALATAINDAYAGAVTHHGHREVAAKACPVFDYRAVLELDRFGKSRLRTAKPVAAAPARMAAFNDTLLAGFGLSRTA